MSERAYDFLDQGFDVAFHTRHVRDSNLMLKKIADLKFALCASPIYLRRAGAPAQVAELGEHDCLVNTNDPIWHLRHAGHHVHLKISDPVYSSNSYLTLRKAKPAGRGIGLLAGEKDSVLSTATVRRAGELLPRAQVEIVPGGAALDVLGDPALFNDAVGRFLARVYAAEPAAT